MALHEPFVPQPAVPLRPLRIPDEKLAPEAEQLAFSQPVNVYPLYNPLGGTQVYGGAVIALAPDRTAAGVSLCSPEDLFILRKGRHYARESLARYYSGCRDQHGAVEFRRPAGLSDHHLCLAAMWTLALSYRLSWADQLWNDLMFPLQGAIGRQSDPVVRFMTSGALQQTVPPLLTIQVSAEDPWGKAEA